MVSTTGSVLNMGKRPALGETLECPNRRLGCNARVSQAELQSHVERCLYRWVACEGCGKRLLDVDIYKHQIHSRCMENKLKREVGNTHVMVVPFSSFFLIFRHHIHISVAIIHHHVLGDSRYCMFSIMEDVIPYFPCLQSVIERFSSGPPPSTLPRYDHLQHRRSFHLYVCSHCCAIILEGNP